MNALLLMTAADREDVMFPAVVVPEDAAGQLVLKLLLLLPKDQGQIPVLLFQDVFLMAVPVQNRISVVLCFAIGGFVTIFPILPPFLIPQVVSFIVFAEKIEDGVDLAVPKTS